MSDEKIEQRSTDVPAAKTGAGWRHWHHKSRIVLMLLAAVAIIVYVFQAGLAKQYAGLGAALCVISCGLFLVWHAVHVFMEEDAIEEQTIDKATASSPQLNPAEKEQT